MKYVCMLVVMAFVGCSDKSTIVEKIEKNVVAPTATVESIEVKKAEVTTLRQEIKSEVVENKVISTQRIEVIEKVEPTPVSRQSIIEEPKVTKRNTSNVPTSCEMWSDGSNVCTRVSNSKASCTTNPVGQKMFSCLQWQ